MVRPLPLVYFWFYFSPTFGSRVLLSPLLTRVIKSNQQNYAERAVSRNLSLALALCLLYFFRNFPLNETRQ